MIKFRTISHLLQLFVLPEIHKRLSSGSLAETDMPLQVTQFRAIQRKLPNGDVLPIVELNQEINLIAKVKVKKTVSAGEPLTLDDIHPEECYIRPPEYDGKPAAYFLCKSLFYDYFLMFDCRPNLPDFTLEDLEKAQSPYPILEFINVQGYLETVKPGDKLKLLSNNNWPPAPGYYPYTLTAIHNHPGIMQDESLVKTVSQSYNQAYWDTRLDFWRKTNFFPERIQYLQRAIEAHFSGDYICSAYVLVPQFEGIIKDYLNACQGTSRSGFVNCVKDLRTLFFSRRLVMFRRDILDAIFDYLETGSFWRNTRTITDPSASVNRHGIVHGVFTGFENEEISLKYLILLDALCFILLHDRMIAGSL